MTITMCEEAKKLMNKLNRMDEEDFEKLLRILKRRAESAHKRLMIAIKKDEQRISNV